MDVSETNNDALGNTWGSETCHAGFIIGRNDIQSNAYFNGHMNDIAFFNDVLTSSEVSAIYNSGSPKEEESHSGIIAYYTMQSYSDIETTLVADSGKSKTIHINNSTHIDSTYTP